ncbi:MAG: YraN family protein [Campylobacter sp.]|uniref:YraN family protein n=1 Tax=Campylobacter TaxID=194 RepID=UPI002361CC7E|nr:MULTISPECIES: YraN family protein [Campylobacter]MCI7247518.1 YraN family protein [Campylobacter sp.]MDD0847540.1 YraN family protein [Campylobacter magnus]
MATKNYNFGFEAEDRACEYLQSLSYNIIERNFHSKFGEIDIIAKKADMLHFIEVKATNTANSAIYRITPAKMTKILRTIEFYFLRKGIMCAYEIDALCIDKDKVELIKNITL